jgi:hypothetical protein
MLDEGYWLSFRFTPSKLVGTFELFESKTYIFKLSSYAILVSFWLFSLIFCIFSYLNRFLSKTFFASRVIQSEF